MPASSARSRRRSRPSGVEGLSYEPDPCRSARSLFLNYPSRPCTIVIPDDYISGPFAFFRALRTTATPWICSRLADGRSNCSTTSLEEKTILWWGWPRPFEPSNTAYLRLK